ncbi:MAG: hypothetical protein ACLRRI_09070 [Oscillospiraceae bacterium]
MMKKLVSLLLALVMALGLVVPVWGNDLPSGTEPLFFYGQDNKQEWHYFNGTGLGQGNSVTFDRVYKDEGNDSYTQLTGFTVDSQATAAGLTATVNGGALTVTAANDCDAEVKFVVIEAAGVKYALRVIVNETSGGNQGGQGGPPPFAGDVQTFINSNFEQVDGKWTNRNSPPSIQAAWNKLSMDAQWFAVQNNPWLLAMFDKLNILADGYYLLSENTAVRVTVPGYLQDVVLLSWNKETNTLTVSFNEGLTADRWKSIYTGGGKRDFAALYYTFIYIGEGQRPDYWTWVDGSEKAIDAVIAEAGTKANYDPNDRGITNGIYVARFQNDGEIMALPGNTSYNSTSREIISWKDKSTDYFTNVIDTTGMSNISFTLDEDAGQSYGQGRNWLNELGTPAGNERINTYTTAEGVTLTVNNGLVTAQLDGTKLLDLEKVLASYVTVTAPEGATEYRMVGNGTSTEPGAADDAGAKWEVTSMKDWLAKKEWSAVPGPIRVTPNTLKEQKVGDVSYYVGNTITGVNCCVFEWKFANGTTKVEYVYFNATPYVHTVQTQSVSEVTSAVDKPTLQSNDAALTLKCRMFPQDNENAHYMRLTVERDGQTVSGFSGEYTVFVPYEYVGLTWEEAQKRTEPPVIYHYTDAEVLKEELTGEYTQWGICFKTRSFSPFVISTAAQSSSGGGYYYGGASTPSISAVKTADAAKSATDYTSGIYGLTFRSTAAFSGFKGVQVDGRTIASANYVAEDNGGIEVYLKAVYLRTLKDGRHTVTILSDAGNVTMNFTIGGVDSPTTFDAGIGAYVGMALASVGGMAWIRRRKR